MIQNTRGYGGSRSTRLVLDTVGFGNGGQPMLCNAGLFGPLLTFRHRGLDPLWTKTTVSPTLLQLRANLNNHRPCWSTAKEKLFTQRTTGFACWLHHRQPLRLPLTWFNPFVGVSPKPIHLPAVATALRWSYHHSPNGCDATHFRNGLGGRHNNSWLFTYEHACWFRRILRFNSSDV